MEPIIAQAALPEAPWGAAHFRRLPGTMAVGADDWVLIDDAYGAQMALRERLIGERAGEILAEPEDARAVARATLDAVLDLLSRRRGFRVADGWVDCPDGRRVPVARDAPLRTVGRLIQEDVCVLTRGTEGEHRLAAAIVAFPLGWRLAEKLGLPLHAIHAPIAAYDAGLAVRVQRMLDGLKPGRPLMRANFFAEVTPVLFAPQPRPGERHRSDYARSERQCLVALPDRAAVLFTIHTSVVRHDALPEALRATVTAARGQEGH